MTLLLKPLTIFAPTLLAHLAFSSAAMAQCGSTVSIPAFNATWTIQNSPYCVTQTVQVGNLTIEPGVEIRMAPGASLQVVSWLRANGTREQPVVFRAQDVAAGRWDGLVFPGPVAPGSSSVLSHCVITEAGNSGVRIVDNEQVAMDGCWIHNNTTAGNGAGVSVQLADGTMSILDCDIEGNSANQNGAGVHYVGGNSAHLVLDGCRIAENHANPSNASAAFTGGGIYAAGDITIRSSRIDGNIVTNYVSTARGGGIRLASGTARVENTIVSSNRCTTSFNPFFGGSNAEGGGIFADAGVLALEMRNSVVCCNASLLNPAGPGTNLGSGVFSLAATTSLSNCTIARNAHEGIRIAAGAATIENSIVFDHPLGSIDGTATVVYSDIEGGFAGTGNINFNPVFAGAGCEPEHFALLPFSPCIDAGDPSVAYNDACQPPAQGALRNDMGALGGPGNCGFAGPSTITCGAQTYGELTQSGDGVSLDWVQATGQPASVGSLSLTNGTPLSSGLMLLAFAEGETVVSGVTILVDLGGVNPLPFVMNAQGSWSTPLSLQFPFLVGAPVFLQALELPSSSSPRGSNGLRIATCY